MGIRRLPHLVVSSLKISQVSQDTERGPANITTHLSLNDE